MGEINGGNGVIGIRVRTRWERGPYQSEFLPRITRIDADRNGEFNRKEHKDLRNWKSKAVRMGRNFIREICEIRGSFAF